MLEEKSMESFPTAGIPQLVTSCKNKAVRGRLIDIANKNQLSKKRNNATHIQLFDKIKIGNLNRTEIDTMENDTDIQMSIEEGYFLCNRNNKDIIVSHSESDKPTCKKCIRIANRLINKGLKIYLLKLSTWNKLQDIYFENQAKKMMQGVDMTKLSKELEELENYPK